MRHQPVPISILINQIKKSVADSKQLAALTVAISKAINDDAHTTSNFDAELAVFEDILTQLEASNDRIVKHVDVIIAKHEKYTENPDA